MVIRVILKCQIIHFLSCTKIIDCVNLFNRTGCSIYEFVMLLNGHKNTSDSPNVITASFDSSHYSYFATHPQINTDPLKTINETKKIIIQTPTKWSNPII